MKRAIFILLVIFILAGSKYGETADGPPPVPMEEQPEVLTRGPVNEAFAQPVNLENPSYFTAPKEPPDNMIEEVCPRQ